MSSQRHANTPGPMSRSEKIKNWNRWRRRRWQRRQHTANENDPDQAAQRSAAEKSYGDFRCGMSVRLQIKLVMELAAYKNGIRFVLWLNSLWCVSSSWQPSMAAAICNIILVFKVECDGWQWLALCSLLCIRLLWKKFFVGFAHSPRLIRDRLVSVSLKFGKCQSLRFYVDSSNLIHSFKAEKEKKQFIKSTFSLPVILHHHGSSVKSETKEKNSLKFQIFSSNKRNKTNVEIINAIDENSFRLTTSV